MTTRKEKGMAGIDVEAAAATIARLLDGRVRSCTPTADGMWDVDVENVRAYTMDLLPGYDEDRFLYELLEVENHEEQGFHNEIIVMTRTADEAMEPITLEGRYMRALGDTRDHAGASFVGTVSLASDDDVYAAMVRRHAERMMEVAQAMLVNAMNLLKGIVATTSRTGSHLSTGTAASTIGGINRLLCDLEVGHAPRS
jgi:hypothetical protein